MELPVHLGHTDTWDARVCRIKPGGGFTEKGLTKSSWRWLAVWCVCSVGLLGVCVSLFSFAICGLTYVVLAGLELTLSGWPRMHRCLSASALFLTLDQYSRECYLDCIALVTRPEPLLAVSKIGIFGAIGRSVEKCERVRWCEGRVTRGNIPSMTPSPWEHRGV